MEKTRMQRAFFERLAPDNQVIQLFDFIPEVSFFIKDDKGRFMDSASLSTVAG